jgi:hypothetical protein
MVLCCGQLKVTNVIYMSNDVNVSAVVKINAYRIIDDAVEKAIAYGYKRAYKHSDAPTEQHLLQEIHRAVMNELCEVLKFDEE